MPTMPLISEQGSEYHTDYFAFIERFAGYRVPASEVNATIPRINVVLWDRSARILRPRYELGRLWIPVEGTGLRSLTLRGQIRCGAKAFPVARTPPSSEPFPVPQRPDSIDVRLAPPNDMERPLDARMSDVAASSDPPDESQLRTFLETSLVLDSELPLGAPLDLAAVAKRADQTIEIGRACVERILEEELGRVVQAPAGFQIDADAVRSFLEKTARAARNSAHPYEAAQIVLRELHRIYLQQGHLRWSVSPSNNGQENFRHLGLSEGQAWKAMNVLVTRGLADFAGARGVVITELGIRACDQDAVGEVLPLPGVVRDGSPAIRVEGGFAQAEVEQRLDFLRDPALRQALARDLQELQQALETGLVKASLLLCGTILEAILFDVVDRRPDLAASYRPKRKYPDGFALADFIEIAVEEKLLPDGVGRMAASVTEHRDLIHPAAERRKATKVDGARAGAMVAFLRVIITDLAEASDTGTIMAYETR